LKEQIKVVAEERMKVCNKCSHNSEVRKKTGKFTSSRPDVHCLSCGCTLSAKTACLSCECPLEKWKAVISEEQYDDIIKEFEEDEN